MKLATLVTITIERIKKAYWFPKMNRFVKKYVGACLPCLYHKEPGGKKPGFLNSLPKYAKPHHTLHIDHLGPFVTTKNSNKYILVVVDQKIVYTRQKFVLSGIKY